MLTFIIGMMVGGIVGFFAFCLLTAGKDSDRYEEESERASFEDAQYVQIRDTGTEVRSDEPQ